MKRLAISLEHGEYLQLTPAGCFYAVQVPDSDSDSNSNRKVLLRLMREKQCPELTPVNINTITELDGDKALEQLRKLENAGFISAGHTPDRMPEEKLDNLLPQLLPHLSDKEQVVLADAKRGFFLAFSGFSTTEAEELAVMSSSLRILYEKSESLLRDQLSISESSIGIIDPAGNSELGFWPLFIGNNVFTVIISGLPQLNVVALKQLIWVLIQRYGLI